MLLLGNYQSNLTAFLYEQLLAQLESDISAGQYGGGTLFDNTAAAAIQAAGQNFSTITTPSAGNTAYAEDLNFPLDTLQSRYTAITQEVASVQNAIPGLLAVISKESDLLDKTVAAAAGEKWASQQLALPSAQSFQWNFEAGHGVTSTTYPNGNNEQDPFNQVDYTTPVPDASFIINEGLGGDGSIVQGIGVPSNRRTIPIKQVTWAFIPNSTQTQFEEIYGADQTWAYLSTLEPNPILSFGAPNIKTLLPIGGSAVGLFTATGSVPGGSLPVYVRILFNPRQNNRLVTNATANQALQLSPYTVTANTVEVYTATKVYVAGTDYTVSQTGTFTVLSTGSLVGVSFTILFEEFFPAYQCSIDQTNWSPIVMLDPLRPYPDDTTNFIPIDIQGANFPLTDELGVPLGLFLQMVGVPTSEMELQVTTPGAQTFGEAAQLTISLEHAVYMNCLQLSPFTNFPMLVQGITAFGFTDNIQTTVLDIPVVLDRAAIVTFPRQLVRKFLISFYQQNYALKEYIVEGPDALRRDTLANLQATLPFSVQRPAPAIPQHFEGALYEFGVQDIQAIDEAPVVPAVFISGPYEVFGTPEVIRLDTELQMPDGGSRVFAAPTDSVVSTGTGLNNLTKATWAAWVKVNALPASAHESVLFVKDPATSDQWETVLDQGSVSSGTTGAIAITVKNSTPTSFVTESINNVLNLNQWHRVVVTYNDSTDRTPHIYVDGVEVRYLKTAAVTGTLINDATTGLFIGNDITSDVFNGSISEYKVWNVALNSTQVGQDYNGFNVLPSSQILYLHMEGEASPEPDSSTSGYNGVVTGTTEGTPSPVYAGITTYLGYIAYDGNDAILEQNEIPILSGTAIRYPGTFTADHVNFFVKYVFRQDLSISEELLLQITTR